VKAGKKSRKALPDVALHPETLCYRVHQVIRPQCPSTVSTRMSFNAGICKLIGTGENQRVWQISLTGTSLLEPLQARNAAGFASVGSFIGLLALTP
jgi:hypothetical protein